MAVETNSEKLKYSCPMHPEETSETPGKCEKCGMDLVAEGRGQEHADHAGHHEMMARDFKQKFFVALALVVPILALSPSVQGWLGFEFVFPLQNLVLFALASVVALYTAWPFYKGALREEIPSGSWGMMTLVSLAVFMGYLYSVGTTFLFEAPDFYWEISTLVLVLLLGHWLEMRAVIGAAGALRELAKLIPPVTRRLKQDGSVEEVRTDELRVGDRVLVRAGEKVPVDGVVEQGSSSVNEALITGESKPVSKTQGQEVIGGSVNGEGTLAVRVTKTGELTFVSQIMALVRKAQESKPKTQRVADRAAHWLTIIAIVVGILTFLTWSFVFPQGLVFALTLTITVIVIACPHALGLAIPNVTTITTSLAARNGILIQDMEGLEKARKVSYVVFDKTGTLTKGEFGVTNIVPFSGWEEERVLQTAASLELNSSHVIAESIVREVETRGLKLFEVQEYQALPGKGGRGSIDGRSVGLGNRALVEAMGADAASVSSQADELAEEAKTVVYLVDSSRVVGLIALADVVREESKEAVSALHDLGVRLAMLTGDNQHTASAVARELGIDTFFAEVLPEHKVEKVRELQTGGSVVMFVGDGINDAPALTQADIGVAIGAGTDVAIESAEVVLVANNPLDVVKLIRLSRRTMSKMYQNLFWATGYNLVAIPLAAGVLFPWGLVLRPEWGAVAMSASSIIVVFNALLLRRERL